MQELDDIASSKNSMGNGELKRVSGREIRSQNAFLDAAATEDLTGSAGAENHRRGRRGGWLRSGWGRRHWGER